MQWSIKLFLSISSIIQKLYNAGKVSFVHVSKGSMVGKFEISITKRFEVINTW